MATAPTLATARLITPAERRNRLLGLLLAGITILVSLPALATRCFPQSDGFFHLFNVGLHATFEQARANLARAEARYSQAKP